MRTWLIFASAFLVMVPWATCSSAGSGSVISECAELRQEIEDALDGGVLGQKFCDQVAKYQMLCSFSPSRPNLRLSLLGQQDAVDFSKIPEKCEVILAYLVADRMENLSPSELSENIDFINKLRNHSCDDELVFLLAETKALTGDHEAAVDLFESYFSGRPLSQGSFYSVHRTRTFLISCIQISEFCRAKKLCGKIGKTDPEYGAVATLCEQAKQGCTP